MKRLFDIIASVIGLIFLSPVFVLISLLIWIDDPGPVFFMQKRVGKGGKPFVLCKFRSMYVLRSAKQGKFEPGNTLRVTRVGKFLRKTKLDEIPQLINVIIGNMSLVGPRPEVEKWVNVYPERWRKVLTIKPGITDNASILFRSEEQILTKAADPEKTYQEEILPKKLELYENYIDNRSFFSDLRLIAATILNLLKSK